MFGKVVQLLGIENDYDFRLVYGIHDNVCKRLHRHNLGFAELLFYNCSPEATTTYIRGGHSVKEKGDGFKEISVFNGNLESNDKEEYLMVCIPYSNFIRTNAKRIAGRYPGEAILEMHAGDTVQVSKVFDGRMHVSTYMAVQAGNEMFLIKKTR